ncbi:MAG: hypothetical protein N4A39_07135 [Roseicyclus sp.]|jgi:hypothetical protein|nr:hypothetical protein [Roseicyclus sp.]
MSAPSTNVETEERRHKPVLIVLRALIALALIALAGFIGYQIGVAGDPSPSALPSVETN